jgi:signal transduction histidine kinase
LKHIDLKDGFTLFADFCIIIICALGIYLNSIKTDLPFKTKLLDSGTLVVSKSDNALLSPGDTITAIDGHSFSGWEEIEFYLDGKSINDDVTIASIENGNESSATIPLTSYYSFFNLIIMAVVGGSFLLIAIIVRNMAKENTSANILHWACLGLGIIITCTATTYVITSFGYGYFNRIFWLISYSFTPVLFTHFTTSFSNQHTPKIKGLLITLYTCSVIYASVLIYLFIKAGTDKNIVLIKSYVFFFDKFFRFFLIACILIAISICIYIYAKATDIEVRKRLQWLLMGFFVGPFSFAIFWVFPIIFTGSSLIPESLIIILLIAMPLSFSIAIVKYRMLDINFIINRSVVYTGILLGIVVLYAALSGVISLFVSGVNPLFPSAITAVAIAFLLQPVKTNIQKFVDKRFFRVEYDFRREQNRFLDDIKNTNDIKELAQKIVSQTDELIPVDKIGFFQLNTFDNRIRMISNNGWEFLKGRSLRFEEENLKTDLSVPVAVSDKVEPGLNVEAADARVFKRWGMMLVFPIKSPSGLIHAFLALGLKKSGARFYKDDVDLLNTVSAAAALTIDRIKLQEDLIREHLEAERLEEINRLKSFFMQIITHDMNQPVTNIKIYSELLLNNVESLSEKFKKHVKKIHGENELLGRLINDILDYSMIEQNKKTYQMLPTDINAVLTDAINSMQYKFTKEKQEIEFINKHKKIIIKADTVAIERAIINLLTNAVKYSGEGCKTTVSLITSENTVGVQVVDQGSGIPEKNLVDIFEPYTRITTETTKKTEGTGLGLAVVKHVMNAHCGRIEVKSKPGKGSTFTLWFPISNE